jgi:hypothetical protein
LLQGSGFISRAGVRRSIHVRDCIVLNV